MVSTGVAAVWGAITAHRHQAERSMSSSTLTGLLWSVVWQQPPTCPVVFVCSNILECRPTRHGSASAMNLCAVTETGALEKSLRCRSRSLSEEYLLSESREEMALLLLLFLPQAL